MVMYFQPAEDGHAPPTDTALEKPIPAEFSCDGIM